MIRFGKGRGGDGAEGRVCCQALKALQILDTMVKQNDLCLFSLEVSP